MDDWTDVKHVVKSPDGRVMAHVGGGWRPVLGDPVRNDAGAIKVRLDTGAAPVGVAPARSESAAQEGNFLGGHAVGGLANILGMAGDISELVSMPGRALGEKAGEMMTGGPEGYASPGQERSLRPSWLPTSQSVKGVFKEGGAWQPPQDESGLSGIIGAGIEQAIPALLTGGGSLPGLLKAGTTGMLGGAAAKGTEELGGGPAAQLAAGVLAPTAGGMAGKAISKASSPLETLAPSAQKSIPSEKLAELRQAREAGIPVPVGGQMENVYGKRLVTALENLAGDPRQQVSKAITGKVAEGMGLPATGVLSREVYNQQMTKVGQEIGEITRGYDLAIGDTLPGEIEAIRTRAIGIDPGAEASLGTHGRTLVKLIEGGEAPKPPPPRVDPYFAAPRNAPPTASDPEKVKPWFTELAEKGAAGGVVKGEDLQKWHSEIQRHIRALNGGTQITEQRALMDFHDSVMDTLGAHIAQASPEDAARLQTARGHYKTGMTIEPAMAKSVGGVLDPADLVSAYAATSQGQHHLARGTGGLFSDINLADSLTGKGGPGAATGKVAKSILPSWLGAKAAPVSEKILNAPPSASETFRQWLLRLTAGPLKRLTTQSRLLTDHQEGK